MISCDDVREVPMRRMWHEPAMYAKSCTYEQLQRLMNKILIKTNHTSPNLMGLRSFITEFLRPPPSSTIRSPTCHHNIALSRDIHNYVKIQRNRKPGSCMRPLSLFYSDASADGVEERSLVPSSRLRRNATMSHAFSYAQPAFNDL
ncbi:hypothetical protein EVAR_55424_1 [Eumeta japonica]|uniref:Uncharacterized protein n=1 Tax=Eumeta variegata TaxID=151549 RepID=A0A4C1Z6W0_EUMVA|nr:hypothetical protein EVAR_55424_1 [Eumeta japonica]